MDIVDLIVQAIKRRRAKLLQFFESPGQLILDIDPQSKSVKLTIKVRV